MPALVPVPRAAIIATVQRQLRGVPEVAAAYLFGSALEPVFRHDSDIDLGIVARPGADVDQVTGDVEWACRPQGEHFSHATVLNASSTIFAFGVISAGRLIYIADDDVLTGFIARVALRYEEVGPPYERALREMAGDD